MKAKTLFASLAITSLLLVGGPAVAELNTIDAVPASTLLLPYFAVDINAADSTSGLTTLFSINNASAAPAVAHVTVWSDLSVPVLDFDVFLTGYDVQTVNLYDVFVLGNLPITAHAWADVADTISPHGVFPFGPFAVWDSNPDNLANPRYFGCDAQLPLPPGALNAVFLAYVQNALDGNAATSPQTGASACYGSPSGDGVLVGYITVDNVNDCNLLFPGDAGYFGAGGFAIEVNQLWGDWFLLDAENDFAFGETLVHVEGAPPMTYVGGLGVLGVPAPTPDYTFYGRYTFDGVIYTDADQREPLATTWGSRYQVANALFTGGTDLFVWRDSKVSQNPFVCGTTPNPFPLNETQVVAFDEAESAVELCFNPGGGVISPPIDDFDEVCFPWEVNRVAVGETPLDVPFPFGWLYLNLNTDTGVGYPGDVNIAQSYVLTQMSGFGRFSVGFQAVELTHASDSCVAPCLNGWDANFIIPGIPSP